MSSSHAGGRLSFVVFAAVLALATSALAQVRRISGTVTDEHGAPVADALVEVSGAALARDADFAVSRNTETWRTSTNSNGDYTVMIAHAGEYLVSAQKEGLGSNRIAIAVRQNGLVRGNLTLWRVPPARLTGENCGPSTATGAFKRRPLAAGADAGLVRLLAWLEAVHLHMPGCSDEPAKEMGRLAPRDLAELSRDVRELVTFLRRVQDVRAEHGGRESAQIDQLIFHLHGRRMTVDELEREFFENRRLSVQSTPAIASDSLLLRGAVMHADVAMFVPGILGRYPVVEDGGQRGWRGGSSHWGIGRQLLASLTSAATDAGLLWYRAVSAHLFHQGNLAELVLHLNAGRQAFPENADLLFDSGCLHHALSSPAIQASVQQLRATGVAVAIGSRTSELERAEHFLRDALRAAADHQEARLRLGHVLSAQGRHQDAAVELRTVILAKPPTSTAYLSLLFLGREDEALGRYDEARRQYEQAAALVPGAQSPRLALSALARRIGDRASAQRALQSLPARSDLADPWWNFYEPHKEDADALMDQMRRMGR